MGDWERTDEKEESMAHDKTYREAEKRIKEALLSSTTNLSLSHLNIRELPESLSQLTQLKSLDLYENQLSTLPEWLVNLKELEELNLSFNGLRILPNWLECVCKIRKQEERSDGDQCGEIGSTLFITSSNPAKLF